MSDQGNNNTMTYNPYWDHIGLKEKELKNGQEVLELPIIHEITQSSEYVHGGVVASMADAAVGASLRSLLEEGIAGVTVEMKLNYLRPATGTKLTGMGKVIQKGSSIAVGEAVIENDKGKEVAVGIVTYMIQST